MGRRNKNARSRSYTSFQELRNTTARFDLATGEFAKKATRYTGRAIKADLRVSIISGGRNQGLCVALSFSEEMTKKLRESGGKFWTCGIVRANDLERLYIIPDEMGYALTSNKNSVRGYTKMPIENVPVFDKYIGLHELKYDEYNKAYYVEAD